MDDAQLEDALREKGTKSESSEVVIPGEKGA